MPSVVQLLPEVTDDEQLAVAGLIENLEEDQARTFAVSYRSQRKDPNTILLVTLLGFVGIGGVQRFMLDQIGMGLLYLFTGGIFGIGTIVDLVRYKKLTFEHNQKKAERIAMMVK